jgi:alpha-mannosidase
MKKIHLLSNAHLDPVWLWNIDEGVGEALSTFRIAAEFCEEYEGYVFNHNEAILYEWVEKYDPELFENIRKLVKEDKWHIMGGWFLQPDCNMPSGEAMVRQIMYGRKYFYEKFGVLPKVAINFDSFGHSQGLVQILKKSGYEGYIFGRPFEETFPLENETFKWKGFAESDIIAHRAFDHYLTLKGKALDKVNKWESESSDNSIGLVLWGIGNHGGGPSKIDLEMLGEKIAHSDNHIEHSTPEAYFEEIQKSDRNLEERDVSLNPWGVGCYTSQIRIKKLYRELENQLFLTEKMASIAYMNNLMDYPEDDLNGAEKDMLTAQFHDILPGSSVKSAEKASIRLLNHGLEIVNRIKMESFFKLTMFSESGDENNIPIFIFNPHPYEIEKEFECEFQMANQNWKDTTFVPELFKNGEKIEVQLIKEESNLNLDWRKRIVFRDRITPCSVTRYICQMEEKESVDSVSHPFQGKIFKFEGEDLSIVFDTTTGNIKNIQAKGIEYLKEEIEFLVIQDNADSWGCTVSEFKEVAGKFSLMNPAKGSKYSGIFDGEIESVRLLEDGPVRSVIEAVYEYESSFMTVKYIIPQKGTQLELDIKILWNESDKMLKVKIPTNMESARYIGQTMFGNEYLKADGKEKVSQSWVGLFDEKNKKAMTIINNGIYGSDSEEGTLNLSLLRSPAYSALPIKERPLLESLGHIERIDQGKREYRLILGLGDKNERLAVIEKESQIMAQSPYILSYYPSEIGKDYETKIIIDSQDIIITALKKAKTSQRMVLRLYNSRNEKIQANMEIKNIFDKKIPLSFLPHQVRTYEIDMEKKEIIETDLIENLTNRSRQ